MHVTFRCLTCLLGPKVIAKMSVVASEVLQRRIVRGLTMTTARSCELCDEINRGGAGLALWPKLAGDRSSRIVEESEHYVALVTVGPIARGHCLILPRRHRSAMSTTDDRDRRALMEFTENLRSQIEDVYGKPVVLFEHGAPEGEDSRPCSVSHAHWHLLPTTVPVGELMLRGYNWQQIDQPFVKVDREYLLVGDSRNGYWMAVSDSPIPSQVLRKHAAERMGIADGWDWRSKPAVDMVLTTLQDFGCSSQ